MVTSRLPLVAWRMHPKRPCTSPFIGFQGFKMGVSKNRGTPKWMVLLMENPIKMEWFGGKTHYFRKHPNAWKKTWCFWRNHGWMFGKCSCKAWSQERGCIQAAVFTQRETDQVTGTQGDVSHPSPKWPVAVKCLGKTPKVPQFLTGRFFCWSNEVGTDFQMCETTSWQKICKISSLTMAKLQNLLSGFLCVSFPNGKKTEKKNSKQLWRWWCPSRGGDPCQCFPFGGSRKTGFQCVDSKSSLNCFINSNHLNLKMNWDVRCPKLYQLLNGSKVLRVAPAWPGKKKNRKWRLRRSSEGFCLLEVHSRKLISQWKITIFNKRYIDSNSRCFSIVMFPGVQFKRVPKMEKDVMVY